MTATRRSKPETADTTEAEEANRLSPEDERELLRGNTPTLVLAVLADAPRHGYEIAREINRLSNSALRFKQGTLYPALHALERDEFIAGEWDTSGERPRKVYVLTEAGRAELTRRLRTWRQFTSAVDSVIGGLKGLGEIEESKGGKSGEQPA